MADGESPVVVVATITPRDGRVDDVEAALRAAAGDVHAEEGCLLYALHRTLDTPPRLVMVEKWASADLLDAHSKGAALAALGPKLRGALAGPAEVVRLAPVPAGDAERGQV